MSKEIQIGNKLYNLPQQGQSAPWGEETSDIIEAIVEAVNNFSGPNDIFETSAIVLNTATVTDLNGYLFDSTQVRSFESPYNVYRKVTKTVSGISIDLAGVVTITTSTPHDLNTGLLINIAGSNSSASINGQRSVTSTPTNDTFTILVAPGSVGVAGTQATFELDFVESGRIFGNFSQQGWKISRELVGDSKILISINSSGQMQYSCQVITGSSYEGTMKFSGDATSIL